jgi:prefoldin subunit 5
VALERQLKALNTVVDEVDTLRRSVEQSKFENGEEPETVATWGEKLDGERGKTDKAITTLTDAITEVRSNHIIKEKERACSQRKGT